MDINSCVSAILEGESVKEVLAIESVETSFDDKWKKQVQAAADQLFTDAKKFWDLFSFAPEEYNKSECQKALDAYYKWYQKFLKMDKES